MADLVLPRGELKVLKAKDKDYERGMLVKLLDDGGYKMAYWYDKPNKPYPVEIIVDGVSIKKDGKIVEMKFHPKDYYDKVKEESVMTSLNEDKLQRLAFGIIKDLNYKFPKYNAKRISDFNKVVKYFKSKMPRVSNIKLGQIALDYHNYRQGDMGVKIPTIKKMAHTMRKVGVKEQKMSDKQQYDYLLYMKKYKPDIWRDLQGNKKVKKIMKKFESVNENKLVGMAVSIAKKMKGNMTGAVKAIEKLSKGLSKNKDVEKALRMANEGLDDLKALPKDLKKSIKKNRNEVFFESNTEDGMTTNHIYYEVDGKGYGYTLEFVNELNEAEYQGRKVKLGKIMQGDQKKFKVYVKNPKGNVVKVNFGQGGDAKGGTMRIRKSNAAARKSFRARHNCDNPGPRHKARYWSCRKW